MARWRDVLLSLHSQYHPKEEENIGLLVKEPEGGELALLSWIYVEFYVLYM